MPDVSERTGVDPALSGLFHEARELRAAIEAESRIQLDSWQPRLRRPDFTASAANFAAYLALRRRDLRPLQARLTALGLSSLGRSEGHVLATLDAVIAILARLTRRRGRLTRLGQVNEAAARAEQRTEREAAKLFGSDLGQHRTRIMVTLPTHAATDPALVRSLLEAGMTCARINCAHDGPQIWSAMTRLVRDEARRVGRTCPVLMDLAGPKLRTGDIEPGPPVVRVRPLRDALGAVTAPGFLLADGVEGAVGGPPVAGTSGVTAPASVPVDRAWVESLCLGDNIDVRDVRGRRRRLAVAERREGVAVLSTEQNCLLATGAILTVKKSGHATTVGPIDAGPADIRVFVGERLLLTSAQTPGRAARGQDPARVPCAQPDVLAQVKVGERVLVDDAKIEGRVIRADTDGLLLHVVATSGPSARIRPEKGLNFPDSRLRLDALTDKDMADLPHVVALADVVGLSFVQSGEDMDHCMDVLESLGGSSLGVVAKIETAAAVTNLADIVVAGGGRHPFGVMIARGDLAGEIGYERLTVIQEQLLWLCQASHVPVIWATQVLDGLVKSGQPSRAEMTDAAAAERAECVMLNKGPYVVEAVRVLDRVLHRVDPFQNKKGDPLPALAELLGKGRS